MSNRQPKTCGCAEARVCACAIDNTRPGLAEGSLPARRRLTFRQERQLVAAMFLAFMVLAALVAAMVGGCASPVERRIATEPTIVGQGASWEAVVPTPFVALANAGLDPRQQPEYGRNDAALNYRPTTALLATAQWPEPARPDLAYPRRIFLDNRADTLLFFQPSASGYAPRTYWYGGGTYGPSGYGTPAYGPSAPAYR